MDVFPMNIPSVPPNIGIDVYIDVERYTKPISLPPNRIASTELKELKEKLQDLLSCGFIILSVSLGDAPIFYLV